MSQLSHHKSDSPPATETVVINDNTHLTWVPGEQCGSSSSACHPLPNSTSPWNPPGNLICHHSGHFRTSSTNTGEAASRASDIQFEAVLRQERRDVQHVPHRDQGRQKEDSNYGLPSTLEDPLGLAMMVLAPPEAEVSETTAADQVPPPPSESDLNPQGDHSWYDTDSSAPASQQGGGEFVPQPTAFSALAQAYTDAHVSRIRRESSNLQRMSTIICDHVYEPSLVESYFKDPRQAGHTIKDLFDAHGLEAPTTEQMTILRARYTTERGKMSDEAREAAVANDAGEEAPFEMDDDLDLVPESRLSLSPIDSRRDSRRHSRTTSPGMTRDASWRGSEFLS